MQTLTRLLSCSLLSVLCVSAVAQEKEEPKFEGWANVPGGKVWLEPHRAGQRGDSYEHTTGLVRHADGTKSLPITPQNIQQRTGGRAAQYPDPYNRVTRPPATWQPAVAPVAPVVPVSPYTPYRPMYQPQPVYPYPMQPDAFPGYYAPRVPCANCDRNGVPMIPDSPAQVNPWFTPNWMPSNPYLPNSNDYDYGTYGNRNYDFGFRLSPKKRLSQEFDTIDQLP